MLPVLAFGPVSRYVSHISFVLKGVGVLAVLGWVAAALVLNLGLAHFRGRLGRSEREHRRRGAQPVPGLAAGPPRRRVESESKLLAAFDSHVEQLRRFGSMLIEEYREANRTVRFDRGSPAAHEAVWTLARPAPHRVRRDTGAVEEVDLELLNEQYESVVHRVHEEWEQTQLRLDLEGSMSRARPAGPVPAVDGDS